MGNQPKKIKKQNNPKNNRDDKNKNVGNHNKKTKKRKKHKKINILYTNPDGITGKTSSLRTAAQSANAHIIGLAETKLGPISPDVPGYKWVNEYRKANGGGVAILMREDIKHLTKPVSGLEDHDQEIVWRERVGKPRYT